jgi:23S rRNA-/tRNA-specific pseudouridylate synthase
LSRRSGEGEPYLAVHQRLDAGTSGVALFVLSPEANAGLARALAERRVTKTYHALAGRPRRLERPAWTIDAPLALEGSGRRARMVPSDRGRASSTDVRVLRRLRAALLIEARPRTGRRHQIRAHLAAAGLPLLGDVRYGGAAQLGRLRVPRPMLHALRLELAHPVTSAPLVVECPYPRDFQQLLAALAERRARG